jgi:hypothetical protein
VAQHKRGAGCSRAQRLTAPKRGILCSDTLLEILPVVVDETQVYLAVERLLSHGLVDAQPSRGPDAPLNAPLCP